MPQNASAFYDSRLQALAPGADTSPHTSDTMTRALTLLLEENRHYTLRALPLVDGGRFLARLVRRENAQHRDLAERAALLYKLHGMVANGPYQQLIRPVFKSLSALLGLDLQPPLRRMRSLLSAMIDSSPFARAMQPTTTGTAALGFGVHVSVLEMFTAEMSCPGIREALPLLRAAGDVVLPMVVQLDGRRVGKRTEQTAWGYKLIYPSELTFSLSRRS